MMNFDAKTYRGVFRGKQDKNVCLWQGVPYGEAPIGSLRFKRARPAKKHEGILDCTKKPPASPQPVTKENMEISEDCLYLNIWSPNADDKKRPVFFYMHGGSFVSGSPGDEGINGADMAEKMDIVVVSASFRLGALGFLDFSFLGDEFEPNCGLTDAVEALRWVNENIEFFGGDLKNVTLSGQSSGGTMAVALNCVEEAYPYFNRTYALSAGPVLMVNQSQYVKTAKFFLDFMGIKNKDELFSISAEKLVSRQREFARAAKLGAGAFTIDIDGVIMKAQPIPAAIQGITCKKPIFLCTTREEMSFLFIKPLAKALDVDDLTKVGTDQEKGEDKARISELYRKTYGKKALLIQYSDMIFRMGNLWFAETQSKNAPLWLGRFDYATPLMRMVKLHAFHSSELPFLFGNYSKGLARAMFLLSPFGIAAKKITLSLRKDLKEFMETDSMPWEPVSGKGFPAMCYSAKNKVEEAMPPEIAAAYENTAFRERSFTGDAIKL